MIPVPTITDAPLPDAGCDPLAGLDAEGRHLFGLGVLAMSDDLIRTRAALAEAQAKIGRLQRRVANQHAIIRRQQVGDSAGAAELLAHIDEVIDADCAPMARPEMPGALRTAVRRAPKPVEVAAPDLAPQVSADPADEPEELHDWGTDCRPAAEWKPVRGGLWRDRFIPLALRRFR